MDLSQRENELTVSEQIGLEEIDRPAGNGAPCIVDGRPGGEAPGQFLAAGRAARREVAAVSLGLQPGLTRRDDQLGGNPDLACASPHLVAAVSAVTQAHAGSVWTTHVGLTGEEP